MDPTVKQPPCPFWRAATTDQRGVDPNAPAPLDPNKKATIGQAAEMLHYHGGFSKGASYAVAELLVVAANQGFQGKIHGLLTQTFVPNHLSGGLLDKELDTGMLRSRASGKEVVGEFSQTHFDAMFSDEHASDYKVDGEMVRGISAEQLDAFVDKNVDSVGAGKIHELMARFEMKNLLLEKFGRDATLPNGEKTRVVTQRAVEIFYRNGIFPHAHLDAKVDAMFPTQIGADKAVGKDDPIGRMTAAGMKGACPFMGAPPPQKDQGTENPAFRQQ